MSSKPALEGDLSRIQFPDVLSFISMIRGSGKLALRHEQLERTMIWKDGGILDNGFARVRCTGCRKDMLVAFSCKGRGLCPSCAAKRAAETANRLREEVLEPVGHAQWVYISARCMHGRF